METEWNNAVKRNMDENNATIKLKNIILSATALHLIVEIMEIFRTHDTDQQFIILIS